MPEESFSGVRCDRNHGWTDEMQGRRGCDSGTATKHDLVHGRLHPARGGGHSSEAVEVAALSPDRMPCQYLPNLLQRLQICDLQSGD
jgi:hypothetical protein